MGVAAPKVPRRPPAPLTRNPEDLVAYSGPLWRIAATVGPHVLKWDALRAFGPLRTMRWDPHRPPPSVQPDRAVTYVAPDVVTVVAERFQKYRELDPNTGAPYLYGFLPTRPLELLDLTGDWPIRNGAAHSLNAAPKSTCRAWAAAILDRWPTLDGLQCRSTMDGRVTFVLFPASVSAYPANPDFAAPLTQGDTFARLATAARRVGYRVLPPVVVGGR